jgi:lipid II:glycine glycyltransferase (peptidoglycan interpeptide bridge formation enzyme)
MPARLADLNQNAELLQTGFWGEFKGQFGWRPLAFNVSGLAPVLFLQRTLPGGASLIYVPFGPALTGPPADPAGFLVQFVQAARSRLPAGVVFVRFDLPWYLVGEGNHPHPLKQGSYGKGLLKKAAMTIQPISTVLLDIRPDEEPILARMHHKTRYNLKLAFKKGVEVVEAGGEQLPLWYELSQETKERDKITIHALAYYQTLFKLANQPNTPQVKLLFAQVGEEKVAGIIVAFWGKRAYYLYGASSNRHRNLMPNHALQWRAIQLARAAGCETYDFCGIPPANDPDEAMFGLYRFKTGFGGEIINRYGCYDVVVQPWLYACYNGVEKLRHFYHRVLKKQLR